jgi:hypothetical protein
VLVVIGGGTLMWPLLHANRPTAAMATTAQRDRTVIQTERYAVWFRVTAPPTAAAVRRIQLLGVSEIAICIAIVVGAFLLS